MTAGFTPTFLYMLGGLIVWAARFLAVYGFTGLACARPWSTATIAGFPLLPAIVVASAVIGVAICAALATYAVSGFRSEGSENLRFVHAVAALVAGIAILAIIYETAPVFFLPGCAA
jgi:hypothetical protein